MPITNPLQTAQRPEALGFPPRQAQGLAEILEEAIQANNQGLKEFIRAENENLHAEMKTDMETLRAEFKMDIERLRAEMHAALREQLMRFGTIVWGLVTVAVAIIKLFPNLF